MPRWSLAPCNCKVRAYTIASIVIVAAILGAPLLADSGPEGANYLLENRVNQQRLETRATAVNINRT